MTDQKLPIRVFELPSKTFFRELQWAVFTGIIGAAACLALALGVLVLLSKIL